MDSTELATLANTLDDYARNYKAKLPKLAETSLEAAQRLALLANTLQYAATAARALALLVKING